MTENDEEKQFVESAVTASLLSTVCKAVLSSIVSFFTLEFLKKWKDSDR